MAEILKIRHSSKLTTFSQVLRATFAKQGFLESEALRIHGFVVVPLPKDDFEATRKLMYAIHLQFRKVSETVHNKTVSSYSEYILPMVNSLANASISFLH